MAVYFQGFEILRAPLDAEPPEVRAVVYFLAFDGRDPNQQRATRHHVELQQTSRLSEEPSPETLHVGAVELDVPLEQFSADVRAYFAATYELAFGKTPATQLAFPRITAARPGSAQYPPLPGERHD